jgi:hypothetical protein
VAGGRVTIVGGPTPCHEPHPLTPNFVIASFRDDASVVVEVSGEVDLLTAPRLAEKLHRALRTGLVVVVDLEAVEFMDGSGLRALLRAAYVRDSGTSPGRKALPAHRGRPDPARCFVSQLKLSCAHVCPPVCHGRRASTE